MKMKENVILSGGTYSNKGGLAILEGTLKALKELGIEPKYIIDPEISFTKEFFIEYGINPIYRYSDVLWKRPSSSVNPINTLYPFIKCIINSYSYSIRQLKGSLIWHIGDSSLSDYNSVFSLFGQIVSLYLLKKNINGNLIVSGVSVEPLRTKIGERTLKNFLKQIDHLFARGKITRDYLLRLGMPEEKLSVISDFAFFLDKTEIGLENLQYSGLTDYMEEESNPKVVLIFRDFDGKEYVSALKRLINKLDRDYDLYFIPTSYSNFLPENDFLFLKKIGIDQRKVINLMNANTKEVIGVFSNFDAVISTRLHGTILGILAHIGGVHLYETRKSLEVIKDTFGEIIPLIKLTEFAKSDTNPQIIEQIIEILEDTLTKKEKISNKIKYIIEENRRLSLNELRKILQEKFLLGRDDPVN